MVVNLKKYGTFLPQHRRSQCGQSNNEKICSWWPLNATLFVLETWYARWHSQLSFECKWVRERVVRRLAWQWKRNKVNNTLLLCLFRPFCFFRFRKPCHWCHKERRYWDFAPVTLESRALLDMFALFFDSFDALLQTGFSKVDQCNTPAATRRTQTVFTCPSSFWNGLWEAEARCIQDTALSMSFPVAFRS